HVPDLLGLPGYTRGGCAPVGMKKRFPTYFDETAILFDKIAVSAGVRGAQLWLSREELGCYVDAQFLDLAVD
ncbi:MAG: Cys-tRNA(Pro) deacylase, partial [Lachnospiraceae bacterium]|nr:Cys-tRNA(Pro) deacylase [Lachnospiraceae bacterium]